MTNLCSPQDIELITDPEHDFIDYLELEDVLQLTNFPLGIVVIILLIFALIKL